MAKYSTQILEEELKNKVAQDWFSAYDTTQIVGKIDFSVAIPQKNGPSLFDIEYLLWAEAKKGVKSDIAPMIAQLVLTVGKARTFNQQMPPLFLGAFDAEKIAFVPYLSVSDIFYMNDFNWNVTPSNYETREFKLVLDRVRRQLARKDNLWVYDWEKDEKELRRFIKSNFILNRGKVNKVRITPNNFAAIFNRWSEQVAPTIRVDWEKYKKEYGIIQADFFFADIFSKDNESLADSLKVLLNRTEYRLTEQIQGRIFQETFTFRDNQEAHTAFWNRYRRPPQNRYRKMLLDRRDLLVPPDVRERKGAFFTPSKWVDLSQQYLADYLGEDWQERYYVWDCCAGTGNLLHGLYNKYNIYASTLDDADVRVMKTQQNLLDSHVFQFDFLNDDLQGPKVPESLRKIIADPEERKKLVIYINPPYAEAGNSRQISGHGENKTNVAVVHSTYKRYLPKIGIAGRELFAQFFIRIYCELKGAVLAEFSKLKILQAPNFSKFRDVFQAKLGSLFLVPSDTFDNVKGKFPIGFFIWDTNHKECLRDSVADVYDKQGVLIDHKKLYTVETDRTLTDWLISTRNRPNEQFIAYLSSGRNDFQNQNLVFIINDKSQLSVPRGCWITDKNLIDVCVFFAVRKVIPASWLNDRDQFLYPIDTWKNDTEFQSDCLAYTLFNNNIQSQFGPNHWIPFSEDEVGAKERFDSHFMSDFIKGRIKKDTEGEWVPMVEGETPATIIDGQQPIAFSPEAQAVMDAGRQLWQYYHSQPNANPNASFYDIRRHFQGIKVDAKGKEKMNSDSPDEQYTALIGCLRQALKVLALKIEPKVYEHGFLKH